MSWPRYKAFARAWFRTSAKNVIGPLGVIGTALTIITFFGITLIDQPRVLGILAGILFLLFIIARSIPKAYIHPSEIANRRIRLGDLDLILSDLPRFGLIGNRSVGKSTFLNAVSNRVDSQEETEAPYAVVVPVPETRPAKYVALIDTVGREYPNQAHITESASGIIVFLDHNSGAESPAVEPRRIQQHEHLSVANLVPTLREGASKIDTIILLANKSDLWANNAATSRRMAALIQRVRHDITRVRPVARVEIVGEFSNRKNNDRAAVLKLLDTNGRNP